MSDILFDDVPVEQQEIVGGGDGNSDSDRSCFCSNTPSGEPDLNQVKLILEPIQLLYPLFGF